MPSSFNAGPLFHFLRIGQGAKNSAGKLTILNGSLLQVDGTLHYTPKAAPATCSVGDMYVDSTSKKLMICTASNTWTVVGSQT